MDLREQVARRLACVVMGVEGIAGLSDYEDACELVRADEVIRIAEWARREAKAESHRLITQRRSQESIFVNIEDVLHCHEVLWSCPLTLPPDDWKP